MKEQQISIFNFADSSGSEHAPEKTGAQSTQKNAKTAHRQRMAAALKKHQKQAEPFAMPQTAGKEAQEKTSPKKRADSSGELDKVYETLVSGVKKYFEENHFKRAAIGVSGGVDSSLTLKIAVDALGPENVTALVMPELGLTKQENIDHAKILCEFLKVNYFYRPINSFLMDFKNLPWKPSNLAGMNTKARIRAVLLYNFANTDNALVLGTSNKSEILLGYGTKYGDLAADIEVIGDLYKTEVIKVADRAGLPPEIVYKTPTAELASDQTDEKELGASYADMDKVLMRRELGVTGCVEHGLPSALVQMVFRRIEQNKHKTQMPLVIKVR